MARLLTLAAGLLLACGPAQPAPPLAERTIDVAVTGLSGLTLDGTGTLYSVAERDRAIVRLGDPPEVLPLHGVPDDVDLEAIAWWRGSRFVLASESDDGDRSEDLLFVVDIAAGRARVTETVAMPYAAVGATPADNDGIEGLCVVGDRWIAALEHPHEGLATLAVREADGRWSGRDVRLTSGIGKLSALSCRAEGTDVRVHALERGIERSPFGDRWVARVLEFDLPSTGRLALPRVASDLAGRVPEQPNPEGLVVVSGEAQIVTDNHYRVQVGPTRLLRAPLNVRTR